MVKSFFVSLILHLCIAALFLPWWFAAQIKIGNASYVTTYLSLPAATQVATPTVNAVTTKILPKKSHGEIFATNKKNLTPAQSAKVLLPSKSLGSPRELELMLHDLLQAELKYPANLPQKRNYKLIISFTLLPTGEIEQVAITQSSGVVMLDRLTIGKLKSLSPIKSAAKYLSAPNQFVLPVEWREK